VGDACREPGVQDDGCPAGSLLVQEGTCQAAGIPPEACAEGFVPTDEGGCEPILPADACPSGQTAVPGESECHEVMACGAGRWGDILVDDTTLYVDQSYNQGSGPSDGTESRPYTTVGAAVAAAPAGTLIAMATGSYVEDVRIEDKPLRLWGKCPAEVELVGTGAASATVIIGGGTDGSEVGGLAVRGPGIGIAASDSGSLELHGLWVHDLGARGIDVEDTLGAASIAISSSLVEQNQGLGVFVSGSSAELEAVVVRGTLPAAASQGTGRGISIQGNPDTGAPSSVVVRASVIEQNHDLGVFVSGSSAELEAVVVRDTLPRASDQQLGRGIAIQDSWSTGARSSAVLRNCLIERNREVGVFVDGSDVELEGVVVRDTSPQASDQTAGRGISIHNDRNTGARSSAVVRASLVEQNHEIGIFVRGSDAELEGAVVRDTLPAASDQTDGRGIDIEGDSSVGARSSAVVRGCLIQQNHEMGIFLAGSDVELEGVVVRDTSPQASDQGFGCGVQIQVGPDGSRSRVLLDASLIEHNHQFGVVAIDSDAELHGVSIVDTLASSAGGRFGDGVAVLGLDIDATTALSSCLIAESARAGLAVFGAATSIQGSSLSCNAIQLATESLFDRSALLTDLGDNRCSCGELDEVCRALSVGLEPPSPVDPTE